MGYFKSLDTAPRETESPPVGFATITVEQSVSDLVEKLKKIDMLSDQEIIQMIISKHTILLDYDFFFANLDNREIAQKVFTNERFLLKLLSIIGQLNLSRHQIICCNKLAFDYARLNGTDTRIGQLFLQLSAIINHYTVMQLSEIIGEASAKYLAMIRNSSFVETKNVQRVTNFLVYTLVGYRAQELLDIYIRLFDRMTILFTETMNYIPEATTPDHIHNNDTITITLLGILMNMNSGEMKSLLVNYATDYMLHRNQNKIRLSLHGLSIDYLRITKVVEEIEMEFDLVIP